MRNDNPSWKQFELAVAAFCAALAPSAKVVHDATTLDLDTGLPRQRDVWIETNFGGHFSIRILVSCKRYKRRLTIQQLDAFAGELGSSGAHKGVIYSSSGFTEGALKKAERRGISCCMLFENTPPTIPDMIAFEAYCLREKPLLIAEGVTGEVNWSEILNAEGVVDGEVVTAYQGLSKLYDADFPAFKNAITLQITPIRYCSLTLKTNSDIGPIKLSLKSEWVIYRARMEAWLVNGSYSITDRDFKGNFSTPVIDTWSEHPGPGWEPIGSDEITAGNTIKFHFIQPNIGPHLAKKAVEG